jgi:hypothetical protein
MGVLLGEPGVDTSTEHFERWMKGVLEVEHLSLYGSPVKGTRREDSLAGDLGGLVQKALPMGIYFHTAPLWNLEGGSSTGDFER